MLKIGQRVQDPVSGRLGVVASLTHPDYALCIVPGQPHERFRLSRHAQRRIGYSRFRIGDVVEYHRRTPGRTNTRLLRLRAIVVDVRPLRILIDQPDEPLYHNRVIKTRKRVRPWSAPTAKAKTSL